MSKKVPLIDVASMVTIVFVVFGFYSFKQHMIKSKLANYKPTPIAVTSVAVNMSDWKQKVAREPPLS